MEIFIPVTRHDDRGIWAVGGCCSDALRHIGRTCSVAAPQKALHVRGVVCAFKADSLSLKLRRQCPL